MNKNKKSPEMIFIISIFIIAEGAEQVKSFGKEYKTRIYIHPRLSLSLLKEDKDKFTTTILSIQKEISAHCYFYNCTVHKC
jgi:hypothetical protein